MIQVEIADGISFKNTSALIQAAESALKHAKSQEQLELTIALGSDEELRRLNRNFLGIDEVTDVLSFPADEFNPDSQSQYLGDVIISFPQAERQAQAAGHPALNELQLLVVHGVLHLLGYDHADEEEKRRMWKIQAEILEEIGCEIRQLPE